MCTLIDTLSPGDAVALTRLLRANGHGASLPAGSGGVVLYAAEGSPLVRVAFHGGREVWVPRADLRVVSVPAPAPDQDVYLWDVCVGLEREIARLQAALSDLQQTSAPRLARAGSDGC